MPNQVGFVLLGEIFEKAISLRDVLPISMWTWMFSWELRKRSTECAGSDDFWQVNSLIRNPWMENSLVKDLCLTDLSMEARKILAWRILDPGFLRTCL